MRGILKESVRGALVRFFRLIIYVLIILLITFIVGLVSGKKAKALVIKDSITEGGSGDVSGHVNGGSNYVQIEIPQSPAITPNNRDLIGFRINKFTFNLNTSFSQFTSCTGRYQQGAENTITQQDTYYPMNWSCSQSSDYEVASQSNFYNIYALVDYQGGGTGQCYLSSEFENYFLCPTNNTNITKLVVFVGYNTPYGFDYNLQVSGSKLRINYDSTDIINSQFQIINQQQQTNQNLQGIQQQQQQQQQYMQDNNTSGSTSTMQGGVSDLTTSINSKLGSVNDLTQVVLLPITLFMDLQTDTCQPLHLVVPFTNNDVYLPCMLPIYQEHFGPLLTLFQTVIGGITGYWLAINIGKLIKEIVDCDNDRIEVLDL